MSGKSWIREKSVIGWTTSAAPSYLKLEDPDVREKKEMAGLDPTDLK